MSPLFGVTVMTVEPGTVIKDEATGQQATVTDECAVSKQGKIYVTPATFTALKNDPRFKDIS